MKYYVIEISEGDAKIKGKGIHEYNSRNEAIASFHSKMGVAMKSELYTKEQLIVVDSENCQIISEVFDRNLIEV